MTSETAPQRKVIKELMLTRVFNAPIEVLFKAWTNEKMVANWWSPKHFTNPRAKFNARVGGAIMIDMQAPDGVLYPMTGTVLEIDPPNKIVFEAKALIAGRAILTNINTVTFKSVGNKTEMNLLIQVVDATPEAAGPLSGMEIGWNQSLDKLESVVDLDKPFVIERLINAPADIIWSALTDPARTRQWSFDFTGFKPEVGCEFEFNGGPPQKTFRHLAKVTEVDPERKLSYSWRYDGYPGNSLVSFELFPKGDATLVRLTHSGTDSFGAITEPGFERHNFAEGWTYILGVGLKSYAEQQVN